MRIGGPRLNDFDAGEVSFWLLQNRRVLPTGLTTRVEERQDGSDTEDKLRHISCGEEMLE